MLLYSAHGVVRRVVRPYELLGVGGVPAARVVVVGGGAGGVELALAMQHRLKQLYVQTGRDPEAVTVAVVNRGQTVLSSHNRYTVVK